MDETRGGDADLILRDESILLDDSIENLSRMIPPSLSLSSDKPRQTVTRVATEKTPFHKASFSQLKRLHGSSESKLKPASSFDYQLQQKKYRRQGTIHHMNTMSME